MKQLEEWLLSEHGTTMTELGELRGYTPYQVNCIFEQYGRMLWDTGRVYWEYAETLNAFTAKYGEQRRAMGRAWDLARAWLRREPGEHYAAMPEPMLMAIFCLALLWGWPIVAALCLGAFAALLRPVECLNATRSHLHFSSDQRSLASSRIMRSPELAFLR